MRSKRKRTATKLDADFVDPDSDEFYELLEGKTAGASSRKRAKQQEHGADSSEPQHAAAATDYEPEDADYQPEHEAVSAPAWKRAGAVAQPPADEDAADDPGCDAAAATAAAVAAVAAYGQQSYEGSASQSVSGSGSDADDDSDYEGGGTSKGRSTQQGKQQQQQPKEKKPRKPRLSTRRMPVTYAKAQYKLNEKDLAVLTDVEYRRNPHYKSAPPMRLYLVRELEELAARKQQRLKELEDTKEERAAARAQEQRERKAAAAAAAAAKAAAFDTHRDKEGRHGSVALPDTCLARIMACLANTLEPGELRGPSAVAQDIANASLVCWDFYHAAKAGFIALGEATSSLAWHKPYSDQSYDSPSTRIRDLPGLNSNRGGWDFWDQVVQAPTELKLPQLKAAAKELGLQVTGTKAELMLRVLDAFELPAPTTAPARLLRALLLERAGWWDGPDTHAAWQGCRQLTEALSKLTYHKVPPGPAYKVDNFAELRARLVAEGYTAVEEVVKAGREAYAAAVAKVEQEAELRRQREQEKWALRQQQRAQQQAARAAAAAAYGHPSAAAPCLHPHVPGGPANDYTCACGNKAAVACSRGCCGHCCKVQARAPGAIRCGRHNT